MIFNKTVLSLLAAPRAQRGQTISNSRTLEPSMKTFNIKSLNASLSAALKGMQKAAEIADKAQEQRNATLTKLADDFHVKGVTVEMLKGNSKTSAVRAVIKGFFDGLVEKGMLTKATGATYQSCFWIAFEQNVPFSPSLANQKTATKKASANTGKGKKAADAAKVKGSIVVKASRDNLQSLLLQAIKMAKDLSLANLADDLADVGKEYDLIPNS